ncbi:MAG: hydroxyacylglutathione hydrolase [Chromatiales bacterium]|nr:hydroxyacylglutathione hydrolase [Chromatiales bacterium]
MWQVQAIPAFTDNYLWLLKNDYGHNAAIVDPGDATPVIATLQKNALELSAILITHHHADHIGGIAELIKHYPEARVYAPKDSRIPMVDYVVDEGFSFTLSFLPASFEVIEVPGHTATHIAFYSEAVGSVAPRLFCGDTVFACGCGRLFEGSASQMHSSLSKIKALPPDTEIYCAHEYTLDNIQFAKWVEPDNVDLLAREKEAKALRTAGKYTVPSQLAYECKSNPFLRFDQPNVKAAAERHVGHALANEAEVFGVLRNWKDTEFD